MFAIILKAAGVHKNDETYYLFSSQTPSFGRGQPLDVFRLFNPFTVRVYYIYFIDRATVTCSLVTLVVHWKPATFDLLSRLSFLNLRNKIKLMRFFCFAHCILIRLFPLKVVN